MSHSRFGFPSGKSWEPKYPEIASDRRSVPQSPPEVSDTGFVPAPPTSHLSGFRLIAPETDDFSARFQGPRIYVRFRAKGKSPASEYWYSFDSFATARDLFEQLRSAEHPGKVIPLLESACLKYEKNW